MKIKTVSIVHGDIVGRGKEEIHTPPKLVE
jgi:hypothetical protein